MHPRHVTHKMLQLLEGFEEMPYDDHLGKLTVGYGWCLDNTPMSREAAELQLAWIVSEKLREIEDGDDDLARAFESCDPIRREALLQMAYQLGVGGLRKFRNMIAAILERRFNDAYREAMDSAWAEQTPDRAEMIADMLRLGRWPDPAHSRQALRLLGEDFEP